MQLDGGVEVLNFLKKKKSDSVSDSAKNISVDDLPEAPKPLSNQEFFSENTSEMPAPPPPKSSENIQEEELEPLPDAPMIPVDKLSKLNESFSVNEPSKINKNEKPVAPKDIDPRDRFDDLLKIEQTPELEAPSQYSEPVPSLTEEIKNPEFKEEKESEVKNELDEEVPPEIVDHLPFEHDYDLPSAEELAEVLAPVLKKEIPESISNFVPSSAETIIPKDLPSFENPLPEFNQTPNMPLNKGFDLPEINMNPSHELLSIYVTVNDYAKVTQTMKQLLRFFSNSGKLLGNADNPEKLHVLNDLFKELNTAQENLMKIDKKLFEGDNYGA